LSRLFKYSALVLVLLAGCGGGGSPNFNVEPEARIITVGDHLPLAARPSVELDSEVQWELEETYGGGLRNSQGESTVYFAPEMAGTYHLTLRADRFDGRHLKQTVAIQVLPVPSVEPASAQVAPGGAVEFTATMKGLPRNTVRWQVDEADGGEVSGDGRYQPGPRPGTFHVTATSTFDPSVSARATVTVSD